jgi:hypothetical protein|tara:strand:- start:86 stop:379 length:294 start_codon:yes stop_codon:yes gene_type:complete
MAGKFRETVIHRATGSTPNAASPANKDDEKAADSTVAGANDAPDMAQEAPALSQDAINALAEAKAYREAAQREIGGPKGPEPTRFGDWENKGRCIDF